MRSWAGDRWVSPSTAVTCVDSGVLCITACAATSTRNGLLSAENAGQQFLPNRVTDTEEHARPIAAKESAEALNPQLPWRGVLHFNSEDSALASRLQTGMSALHRAPKPWLDPLWLDLLTEKPTPHTQRRPARRPGLFYWQH